MGTVLKTPAKLASSPVTRRKPEPTEEPDLQHAVIARGYAREIVDGSIPACRYVREDLFQTASITRFQSISRHSGSNPGEKM
jgi:hypothetical protein